MFIIIKYYLSNTIMNFNNPLQSTHQKTNAKSWISISSSSASNSFFSQNYSIKTIPNQTRYVKYT